MDRRRFCGREFPDGKIFAKEPEASQAQNSYWQPSVTSSV